MRWQDTRFANCSAARALSLVGDRWTLLVLRDAFRGLRRFEQFRESLGVTRHRLADRLARLVAHGVLKRVAYQDAPARYEYRLTDKGRELYPVIAALVAWGDRWMAGPEGVPLLLVHAHCGAPFHAIASCSQCGEPVTARDVALLPGPGFRMPPVEDGVAGNDHSVAPPRPRRRRQRQQRGNHAPQRASEDP